jgi:hypothetical protein
MIRSFHARSCRIFLTILVASFNIIGTIKARALILAGMDALASQATPLLEALPELHRHAFSPHVSRG